ncbi:MAG TPA: hypothetical protein VL475_08960, partial [Planctomycetaceae bacterium]|nr:hypothetical protein [Planctomycetaceae bacterium]
QVPKNRWRFRMHLFRAYYDAYTRARLLYETELERQALEQLAAAPKVGATAAIEQARATLKQASTKNAWPELRAKLDALGEELFQEIGLQTSVPRYKASGYERGAVLDFIDYPLNNRWWLEDQFDRISRLADRDAQLRQLDVVRNWENPGEGGYYDIIGHVGRSPRVAKLYNAGDQMRHNQEFPAPTQKWFGEKHNNLRLAWHIYLNRVPSGIVYNDLDSSARYVVRLFSQRQSPLLIDGEKAKLLSTGDTYGEVTEQTFEVPKSASADGTIKLTWEQLDETNLNWRNRHYVTDIWVMKKK